MGYKERKWGEKPSFEPDETIKYQHILDVYNSKFVTINRFMHIDQMKVIMCRLDTLDILHPNRTDSNEKKVKIEYDGETFYFQSESIKFYYREFVTINDNTTMAVKYNKMNCTESGVIGTGTIQYDDGYEPKTYIGEIKNGIANGKGIIKYDCGDLYNGYVYNGKAHGYGEYEYYDEYGKTIWRGYFKHDIQHGYAEQYQSDGSYYKGEFIEGELSIGVYDDPDTDADG